MIIQPITVPYGSGRLDFRAGRGPAHLLAQGFIASLNAAAIETAPVQTLSISTELDTEVEALFALHSVLSQAVEAATHRDMFPLILAGNCSSTVGTVSGLDKEGLGIIWFDAHGDYNTPETTSTGYLDGMALSILTGQCWQRMTESIPGFVPLDEQRVMHIGGRDFDEDENILMHGSDMYLLLNEDLQRRGIARLVSNGLQSLSEAGVERVHLHFDLDVLDPVEAPANFYNDSSGLSIAQAIEIIGIIRQQFPLASAAFTAYDPTYDPQNKTVEAAKQIAHAMLK